MLKNCFIDKLCMYQEHVTSLPEVSVEVDLIKPLPLVGTDRHVSLSLDMEDLNYETISSKQHKGSYNTSIQVRCDGSRVSIQGNPSKFGRLDNLFGYQTIDECVELFNAILACYDLPPFTKATYYKPMQSGGFIHDGAIITNVDLTRNHMVGCDANVLPALRAMSSHTSGRKIPHLYPNGQTVDWIYENSKSKGSGYLYSKLYGKAHEMELHKTKYEITEEEQDYLNKLHKYVKDAGCIREEHSLKSRYLKRHNAYIYGIVDEKRLCILFEKVREMMTKSEATVTNYQNVMNDLLTQGIVESPTTAARLQDIVYAWQSGENLRARSSKAVFYKNRRLLLNLGIDIKLSFDITRMNTKIKIIELRDLHPPSFYCFPSINSQLGRAA